MMSSMKNSSVVEENWSLAQKVGEEEREIGQLEQELNDLDRQEPEREEAERQQESHEQDQPGHQAEGADESANPDDATNAQEASTDWLIYGEEQREAEQALNDPASGRVPEWEKDAYSQDVIERTQDLQLEGKDRQDGLTEQQIMQQVQQQQQLAEQNSLSETMRRQFLGEGKEREQGGEKDREADDRGER